MPDETRQERFEAVFRAHVALVRRYVARRTGEGVDDVVAETFPAAWRRLDDVPADAAPWLLGTARRMLANQRRAAPRRARRRRPPHGREGARHLPVAGAGPAAP